MLYTNELLAAEVAYRTERISAAYRPISSDERYAARQRHQHLAARVRRALSGSIHRGQARTASNA